MAGLGKLSYRGFAKPGLCRWLGWGNREGRVWGGRAGEAGKARLGNLESGWGSWQRNGVS